MTGRSAGARGPLLGVPPVAGGGLRVHAVSLALIALVTVAVFAPTLRNGFLPLGFDDALILDTPAIRGLSWPNVRALFSEFNHAHYVPLTMLSFAVDYHFWGLNPVGYHLGNVLLHAVTAMLAYVFLWPLLGSVRLAALAALLFAVHPVQMESVSVAMQRKSVLSGVLFFLTLILYRRWCRRRSAAVYAGTLVAFAAAALAKPAVVTLPCLLLLYDYAIDSGEWHVAEKLPFFAISAAVTVLTMLAHAAVGALQPPHGGNRFANLLMVSRVMLEYVDALVLPVRLSPVYYYRQAVVYSPLNFAALAVIVGVCAFVTLSRRRHPWSFFCLWWFLLALLPESNLVPLAQLRADRFLYLGVLGFALWVVVGVRRLEQVPVLRRRWRGAVRLCGPAVVGMCAVLCYTSAGVWRSDVSAWRRVVERHPWCAVAHVLLGRADYEADDVAQAERQLTEAVRLSPRVPEAYLYLAKVYTEQGRRESARTALRRYLALEPGDAQGVRLLAALAQAPRP